MSKRPRRVDGLLSSPAAFPAGLARSERLAPLLCCACGRRGRLHSRGQPVTSKPFGAAIYGCDGAHLTSDERAFFAKANPFGFILFDRNLEDHDQIRALTSDLRDAVGWAAPIFIDQEGGRVQRLRAPLATDWLPPLDHVTLLGDHAVDGMRLRYQIISHELTELGIDANCAPMLDIARPETHPFLRNRCYGSHLDQVVKAGRAVVEGHLSGGVFPVGNTSPDMGWRRWTAIWTCRASTPRKQA